jgi:hypothetical protein
MRRLVSSISPSLLWLILFSGGWSAIVPGAADARIDAPYRILHVPSAGIIDTDFDPFGGYQILGRKPRDLADFNNFTLEMIEPPVRGQPLAVVGGVIITTASDSPIDTVFQMAELDLTATRLAFATETRGRVSYRFEGRFLKKGDFAQFRRTKVAVLEGVMTKCVDGTKQAARALRFTFVVWKVRYYSRPASR